LAKHLHITGIVQGVGYRAGFDAQARALGLAGWVRNRRDGSVEAMVRGERDALQELIAWTHRGPATARVEHVEIDDVDDRLVEDSRFEILPTE
jgi:acylphosphatase